MDETTVALMVALRAEHWVVRSAVCWVASKAAMWVAWKDTSMAVLRVDTRVDP